MASFLEYSQKKSSFQGQDIDNFETTLQAMWSEESAECMRETGFAEVACFYLFYPFL